MRKLKLSLLVLLLLIGASILIFLPKVTNYLEIQEIKEKNEETLALAKENTQKKEPAITPMFEVQTPPPATHPTAYLEVPFICQAPLQTEENWQYHEESCEEAAVLQSYLYLNNQTMTKQEAHEEILKMTDWQIENFGDHHDIYADEVKKFAIGYYGLTSEDIDIIYGASLEDIKKYISEGYPVIVPIMGNILNNPYYPHPGYHMLVVIGYTEDMIITNDNGTRRGADFSYENQVFLDAMTAAGGDIVIIKAKTTT